MKGAGPRPPPPPPHPPHPYPCPHLQARTRTRTRTHAHTHACRPRTFGGTGSSAFFFLGGASALAMSLRQLRGGGGGGGTGWPRGRRRGGREGWRGWRRGGFEGAAFTEGTPRQRAHGTRSWGTAAARWREAGNRHSSPQTCKECANWQYSLSCQAAGAPGYGALYVVGGALQHKVRLLALGPPCGAQVGCGSQVGVGGWGACGCTWADEAAL